jgi:hypothetical protein
MVGCCVHLQATAQSTTLFTRLSQRELCDGLHIFPAPTSQQTCVIVAGGWVGGGLTLPTAAAAAAGLLRVGMTATATWPPGCAFRVRLVVLSRASSRGQIVRLGFAVAMCGGCWMIVGAVVPPRRENCGSNCCWKHGGHAWWSRSVAWGVEVVLISRSVDAPMELMSARDSAAR